MLVLSRKPGEKIVINNNVTVTVVAVVGNRVKLALEAPGEVQILRGELVGLLQDPDLAHKPTEWESEALVPSCVVDR